MKVTDNTKSIIGNYNFEIGMKIEQYKMKGVVKHIFPDKKTLVIYFEESNETIEFDFDEFPECRVK